MKKIAAALLGLAMIVSLNAEASPKLSAAQRAARKVQRDQRELVRRLNALTPAERNTVKSAFDGTDADCDGVPNFLEDAAGSDACNVDTDNDGVQDNEDGYEGNPDGDGDGNPDGSEVEQKGAVSSVGSGSFVLGGVTFLITNQTVFKGLTSEQLASGTCVEVKGHVDGSSTFADEVKRERRCGGDVGGGDGGKGGNGGGDD